jgi:GNAT superfamily N-acetyltransferase
MSRQTMRITDYTFTLSDSGDEAVRRAIVAPLMAYNESQAGPSEHRPLAVVLRDASQLVVGGLWGATGYGWLYTQLLVVPESARGQGLGTRLMAFAEAEARVRGCGNAWLDTFQFQARAFYERLGYSCFGELPHYPAGCTRSFMRKSLGPPHGESQAINPAAAGCCEPR